MQFPISESKVVHHSGHFWIIQGNSLTDLLLVQRIVGKEAGPIFLIFGSPDFGGSGFLMCVREYSTVANIPLYNYAWHVFIRQKLNGTINWTHNLWIQRQACFQLLHAVIHIHVTCPPYNINKNTYRQTVTTCSGKYACLWIERLKIQFPVPLSFFFKWSRGMSDYIVEYSIYDVGRH